MMLPSCTRADVVGRFLLLLTLAGSGCAHASPRDAAPAGAPAGAAVRDTSLEPTGEFVLTGRLSRKGPAPRSWWGITDDSSRIWRVAEPSPEMNARLERLQNERVTVRVLRRGEAPLQEVQVLDVLSP